MLGGGVDESFIRGTRLGLVCLGTRIIRAALQETNETSVNEGFILEDDLDATIHPESMIRFDWVELSDDLNAEPRVCQFIRTRRRRE